MKSPLFAAACAAVLVLASGEALAQAAAPGPEDARAFVAKAEAAMAAESLYVNRAAWVQYTYITDDTNWLVAKANAEQTDMAVAFAKQAASYDKVQVDPVTRRKLEILKQAIVIPAPGRPGASQQIADIQARLDTAFSTAKVEIDGQPLVINDLEDRLRTERDPAKSKEIWVKWHDTAKVMKPDYVQLVGLANEGARELGYKDVGAIWRSWYDMPPEALAARTDKVWSQVQPLYRNLHCYVRARLNQKYGDAIQPRTGPIRADLVGNMWAQEWGNIYELVKPEGAEAGYDLTKVLTDKGVTPVQMFQTADRFYQSLGFEKMPDTFWTRSMLTKPRDREVVCHASAWDIDNKSDIRIKMCARVNADDFYTVHHEMGHNIYQRGYADQPYLYQDGANDGFHEAIGDFAGLNALTPTYLKQIGLIDQVPGPEADIPYLLKMALDKVAILPWALLVDRWRWGVFSGEIQPADYNRTWWALKAKYQGVVPPEARPDDAFDPGAKYHVENNTPYTRYFLADIYEFQFYRAACRQAGWKGPLNRCSIYQDKAVGDRFKAMLQMGKSRPWPEALAAFTGEKDIDASAIAEYFAPLNAWLTAQNKGQACGW